MEKGEDIRLQGRNLGVPDELRQRVIPLRLFLPSILFFNLFLQLSGASLMTIKGNGLLPLHFPRSL
jgi:hypothetical protein